MPQITPELLHRALDLLGELMVLRGHPEQHFVVCGGSSLIALGLVRRMVTQDVDILGRITEGAIVSPRPLPLWLLLAADSSA